MTSNNWHSVDALGSEEMVTHWRDHFSPPALVNDLGCFQVMPDPMGIRDFLMPPFSGKGEGTGMLYINRKHPASEDVPVGYTWYPDRVRRRATFEGLEVETVTQAAAGEPAALVRLTLTNASSTPRRVEVGIKVAGQLVHTIDGWASMAPTIYHGWTDLCSGMDPKSEHPERWRYDGEVGGMRFSSQPKAYSVHGTRPRPDRVEGKTFLYDVSLSAGDTWSLCFVVALGETEREAAERFIRLADAFDETSRKARQSWQEKIEAAFVPNNPVFSGHLPAFHTTEENLARLYYMAFAGSLCCRRSNPLSRYGTTYVTLTPNNWTTASFLWDMMIAAPFYAMLDPLILRKMIKVWLEADLRKCHSVEYVTGKGLSSWYAVNNTAIVRLAYDYLRWSGDFEWLDDSIRGKTILEHLEEHALSWHELDRHGHGLADCGGVLNLLECVSTYVHEVPSFNAMWVAALRQVAAVRRLRGEHRRAEALEEDAALLLKNTMGLYADGKGFWRCRGPDGSYNEVRHVYDFIAALESIAEDLPAHVREEMADYFQREHQTGCWMRGLSTWDDDAHRSTRVDLQWTGSYPSLPAQAINGLYRIGRGEAALQWLRRISPIALQGPLGQAHWVETVRPPFKGGAYKCAADPTHGADWVVVSNGAYPAMFIESIFGVRATLNDGLQWSGRWHSFDPDARLENLHYQGHNYRVTRKGIERLD